MDPKFIHLRLHTEYSLVDGIVRLKPLMARAQALNIPAVAITDVSNLFAAVKFYQAAIAAGIKPILGADLWLHSDEDPGRLTRVTVLCKDDLGYKNLTVLISKSYRENQIQGIPKIKKNWLKEHRHGLIILSGGKEGDVGQALLANNFAEAQKCFDFWSENFANHFYLELTRTGRADEEKYINAVLPYAHKLKIPVVATNDVRFLATDDFDAHEARVCIHEGYTLEDQRRVQHYSPQQYLRSADEMEVLFADIPSALINSVEIAKRTNVNLHLGKVFLPDFPIPESYSAESYLAKLAEEGLSTRLALLNPDNPADYEQRLALELGVINSMGFSGYFLIVADFIQWSKSNKIPVGPGRGSGAGSLVAYALNITDLDPLAFDLLFERFLNPERVSMPDFDIDFCMDQRDRVIDYVTQKYGRANVAQIITYGSMAAKAVIRDVGRVLGHPYGFVDKIAKLIPFELGITLDKALATEEDLAKRYQEEEEVKTLIDLAKKLEGITRNVGKHAGGVVIAPTALTDFSALYCEQDSEQVVTQFDKDDIEAVGLIKFDFLGLRTLTIIDWALRFINNERQQQQQDLIDINHIPLDDPDTFALLKSCATTAIFQLESRGMKDLVKRLQPDCFEDIIALVALFRPGPLQSGMVDDFIDRKHGRAKVKYPHPALEPILSPTYGVILYQEQVMQIAQVLAGYTLGSADLLRRAMGKKKQEEMAHQREIFTKGAVARGVDENTATYIFDLMEKFAGYGFNKSHSAAYALVSYQTAWLKTHYASAFMAAVLSSDMDNTDKVVIFIEECRSLQLKHIPPHINHSVFKFSVNLEGAIVHGLGAIKGVGEAAVDILIEERNKHGNFIDLFDLCRRVDVGKVNRRVLEAMIRAGALDGLAPNRATLAASLENALHVADQLSRNLASGQADLFSDSEHSTHVAAKTQVATESEWPIGLLLRYEKETLGFYLSGHPIQEFQEELSRIAFDQIATLGSRERSVKIAGFLIGIRTVMTKRGNKMGILTIEDQSGRIDVTVFAELYEMYRSIINKDTLIIIEGELSKDDYSGGYRINAERLMDLDQARDTFAQKLVIHCQPDSLTQDFPNTLMAILADSIDGPCPVELHYHVSGVAGIVSFGKPWRVKLKQSLLDKLNSCDLIQRTELVY